MIHHNGCRDAECPLVWIISDYYWQSSGGRRIRYMRRPKCWRNQTNRTHVPLTWEIAVQR